MDARRAAEMVARSSYGRLVAYLASRTRDVAAAEDALGDAFLAALKTWPETGVPQNPESWLVVAARNRLIDAARRNRIHENILETLKLSSLRSQIESPHNSEIFPDDRLKLLFICAHPAINATMHTPLMLQTVLGLSAAQIASAFLVTPATSCCARSHLRRLYQCLGNSRWGRSPASRICGGGDLVSSFMCSANTAST